MFAETLKELRRSRNLNQKQFAKAVFITPSAVSQYETGRTMPSRETMERIAGFFGVSTDYLMGTSTVAELEELMNQEYCDGYTVADMVHRLTGLNCADRKLLTGILEALELHSREAD